MEHRICQFGAFNLWHGEDAVALGLGALLLSVGVPRHFGRYNGGNAPGRLE